MANSEFIILVLKSKTSIYERKLKFLTPTFKYHMLWAQHWVYFARVTYLWPHNNIPILVWFSKYLITSSNTPIPYMHTDRHKFHKPSIIPLIPISCPTFLYPTMLSNHNKFPTQFMNLSAHTSPPLPQPKPLTTPSIKDIFEQHMTIKNLVIYQSMIWCLCCLPQQLKVYAHLFGRQNKLRALLWLYSQHKCSCTFTKPHVYLKFI